MPRKLRRLKRRSYSALHTNRTSQRKQWSAEGMVSAVEAVKRGMSVLRAATLHGVPRTTLQDRVKGRVKHGDKPGPNTYLTPAEEEELASFLMEVARVGYGKTRREVKLLVEAVAREKGVLRGERISDGWFRCFQTECLSATRRCNCQCSYGSPGHGEKAEGNP